MSAFVFAAICPECAGNLRQLTRRVDEEEGSSCEVECCLCGHRGTIEVVMSTTSRREMRLRTAAAWALEDVGER